MNTRHPDFGSINPSEEGIQAKTAIREHTGELPESVDTGADDVIALEGEPLTLEERGQERVKKVLDAGRSMFGSLRERINGVTKSMKERFASLFFTAVGGAEVGVETGIAGAKAAGEGIVAGAKAIDSGARAAGNAIDAGARRAGNAAIDTAYTGAALGIMAGEGAVKKAGEAHDWAARKVNAGIENVRTAGEYAALAGAIGLAVGQEGLSQGREFAGKQVVEGKKWAAEKGAAILGTLERGAMDVALRGWSLYDKMVARAGAARDAFNQFRNDYRMVRGRELARERAEHAEQIAELTRKIDALMAMQTAKAEPVSVETGA